MKVFHIRAFHMHAVMLSVVLASAALLGETLHPGQAGNDNIDLTAQLLLDPAAIRQELGADMDTGYVVAKITATPKTGEPMSIGPSDFVLISRKDGDRADAISPEQITSKSALVLKRDTTGRDFAHITTEPGFTGIAGIKKSETTNDDKTLLETLKAKMLPDRQTKTTVSGLVYFSFDIKKLKPKDLALTYKGRGGRLSIEFK
jgi:hypothetical protein